MLIEGFVLTLRWFLLQRLQGHARRSKVLEPLAQKHTFLISVQLSTAFFVRAKLDLYGAHICQGKG